MQDFLKTARRGGSFKGRFSGQPGKPVPERFRSRFIAAKDGGGGDDWSYKACKAPVKLTPPTNHHPTFLQTGSPSSITALKGDHKTARTLKNSQPLLRVNSHALLWVTCAITKKCITPALLCMCRLWCRQIHQRPAGIFLHICCNRQQQLTKCCLWYGMVY